MNNFNLTKWALEHRAVVLFLIIVISIAGVFSFSKLGQLEDPKFSVPSMTATVIWPGASAQQIQDEVLNRMEKKFEQLDHFDKVVTFARQGYGGLTISVKGGTSHKDQQEAWYQARKKFSDLKLELPEGVVGPIFNDEYGDVYSLLYAVKGDGIGHAELSDISEDIKRRLLKAPYVKKVDLLGKQEQKVYVEFSHERLAALGITPLAIAESLRSQNAMLPAGSIDTSKDRVFVRVSGQFTNLDDIRNVPIAAGGRTIKLGDIATVKRGFQDPPVYTIRHNGQDVLMVGIVDDRRRQRRRARQGRGRRGREGAIRTAARHRDGTRRRPAHHGEGLRVGVRTLADRSAPDRPGSEPAQPGPSHRPDRRHFGAAGARRGRDGDAGDGLEPGTHLARLAHHRARPAGGRLDHRHRDDGGEDGRGLGPHQGCRLLLFRHRDAAPFRCADHRRRLHAHRLRELHHRRIRGRHLLDRRHCRGVLVDLLGHDHALPRGEDAAEELRPATPRCRPVRHAVLPQAPRLDRLRPAKSAG